MSADSEQRAIDALRHSEARLAGIIASAMDAIISVNDAQEIIVFNAAAEAMFRCTAGDAIGTPLSRFIPERFRRAHTGHMHAFGRIGVTTRSMGALRPLTALRADGTEFPVEAAISHVDVGGQHLFSVILRDVIFEPFVQVDHRLTRQFDGVGLGLAISRALAGGMGGRVQAASRLGAGSTFTLSLSQTDPLRSMRDGDRV